jgi:hypothetical protein
MVHVNVTNRNLTPRSANPTLRYSVGPVPSTFGGKRTLDFVLDNRTLKDFNRTLLFDIRLSNIRK